MRSKLWLIGVVLFVVLSVVLLGSKGSRQAVATEDVQKEQGPFQISAFVTHHEEYFANKTHHTIEDEKCLMVDTKTGVLYSLVGETGKRRWLQIAPAPPVPKDKP